jgi:class 3 adenylate cyclase/pimeloyl-ACP methyl ester carboxylesterase
MDPDIRYLHAGEVDIAHFSIGSGPPLVVLPYLPVSNLEQEWRIRPLRQWLGWFAGHRRLVRYDGRLTGLSIGTPEDISLDAHVDDLLAVLDGLDIAEADLLAASFAGPVAIAFAARHPERVRHLALWTTHARHADVTAAAGVEATAQGQAIEQLAGLNLDVYLRTWIHRAVGWLEGEAADATFNLARQTMTSESFPRALRAYRAFDATAELAAVRTPTLVMHRREFPGSSVDVARGLASRIAGARMALFEGSSVVPFVGEATRILQVIDEFLGDEGVTAPRQPLPGATANDIRTILFTDVEGHTAMTQRLGDAAAREVLREVERVTRQAFAAYDGVEVKAMGDGFMASFASAQRALECAVALQRRYERMQREEKLPGRVRMGLNAGEPIAEDGDLFGSAVIAAWRIAELARGGEVLVANVVRELVAGHDGGFGFEDRGMAVLKGFEGAFRIFAVRW